jgi:hypothetical protein
MNMKKKFLLRSVKKGIKIFKTIINLVIFTGFFITINANPLYPTSVDAELSQHLSQTVKAGEMFALVEELSSGTYEGRLTGTEGYNKAAAFAANYFKKYGVIPLGKDYMQTFPLSYTKVYESTLKIFLEAPHDGRANTRKGMKTNTNELAQHIGSPRRGVEGAYFKNFYPLNFSGKGDVKEEIVFAGYGVTAPEFGYDDFNSIDVKGKIVLIFKGVPKAKEGEDWSKYDSHRSRTKNARDHGAVGFIYIYAARGNPNGNYLENFPMVSITKKLADKLFAKANLSCKELEKAVNSRKKASYATGIRAHITVKSENFQGKAKNVMGYIPGADPLLKNEFVVVGAHLDHCGNWPRLTPGADDNASGSAAVLTVAQALAAYPRKPKRSILFILFAGEEMGLLGSDYFASHLPAQIKKVTFVINMDMVGAGPDIFVMRLKNYPEIESLFREASTVFGLTSQITGNKVTKNRPNGDHAPFVDKGIPAISVFSSNGDHHGYHTDADTIYWITPKIMEDIALLVSHTAIVLANNR